MQIIQAQIVSTVESYQMLPEPPAPLLLMASGGADSSALARLMPELYPGYRYTILHVNHQIRGAEAASDEAFVLALAAELGINCEVRRVDLPGLQRERGGNLEELGRELRYSFAADLLGQLEAEARQEGRIVTAHTADDNAETFLMRVIKGAGPSAWAGIPAVRGKIIRPLIGLSHIELTGWLSSQGFTWQEDSSNADTSYLRAFVRHDLIPSMQTKNPRLVRTINRSLKILAAESRYVEEVAAAWADNPLAAPDIALTRRAIRQAYAAAGGRVESLTFELIEQIAHQGSKAGFATSLPGGITAQNIQGHLVFLPETDLPDSSFTGTLQLSVPLATPLGTLVLTIVPTGDISDDPVAYAKGNSSSHRLLVDADRAPGPFRVTSIQAGDRFSPLGMPGRHKLVSDLLIDRKVPRQERARLLKVCQGDDIVWIVGIQADDRYKVKPETRHILSIEMIT